MRRPVIVMVMSTVITMIPGLMNIISIFDMASGMLLGTVKGTLTGG